MPVSRIPGVVASVLYAIPVVIRLVTNGVRGVPPAAVEAAYAFGASRMQVLAKVKIPLARESIMLGVNQGIIMVLAVVVIGGLVGSGALGDMIARGLQRNEFGEGVVASLAILALGIALDRVTQGRDPRRRARPGRRGGLRWAQAREDNCKHNEGRLVKDRTLRGKTVLAVVMALVLALFVAACGEDKDDDVGSGGRRRRSAGQGLRQGRAQRAGLGRLDRQHLHRQGGARGQARLRGGDHEDRRDPRLPGDGRRQGRRRARGLAARRRVQEVHRQGRHGRPGRPARRGGPHRLVHPEVPDGREPRVQDLGGPEGQGGPVQDRRVGRPGHVPGRRPELRAEGQGAHRGARPQLQARDRRRRAGAGRALDASCTSRRSR